MHIHFVVHADLYASWHAVTAGYDQYNQNIIE